MHGIDLQYRQEEHDRLFHTDVYNLPKSERLTHLVLHLGKYLGKLWQLVDVEDLNQRTHAQRAIAVDAVIVIMSIANLFNVEVFDIVEDVDQLPSQYVPMFNAGKIAVAIGVLGAELIDHQALEASRLREAFEVQLRKLAELWMGLYGQMLPDNELGSKLPSLSLAIYERWDQVEQKHQFYNHITDINPQLADFAKLL